MILQALTRRYEDLLAMGEITRPGWGIAKVSYALELSEGGDLLALLSLRRTELRGGKEIILPREMTVPMPVKRTSGISPNFLCDNCSYLIGANEKGKAKRIRECFDSAKRLHYSLLSGARSPAAQAVVAFFRKWDPDKAAVHPALSPRWEDLMKGVNLIFWYQGAPVSDDPEVRTLWQAHYDREGSGRPVRCLVSGKLAIPEKVHPAIKGVQGAQSAGAALVSFNAPAFCSYGHDYAPISGYAAFAYTTALNRLIADHDHQRRIGDTTVVCWAEGGQQAYQDAGLAAIDGDTVTDQDLWSALNQLAQGKPVEWDDSLLDPSTRFYVLGLAPNAARLSVRFFWQNSFGALARNVMAHYHALEIVRPVYDNREFLPLWELLRETVNKNARDPSPSRQMAGDVLRAVLTGAPYPATLLNGVLLRIRAEKEITRGRAAIIKAYYLRKPNPQLSEEVLKVKLNEDTNYPPYVLGRLFSILEGLQETANPGLNTTIKSRYFNSASATPAVVFPILINLAQKHLNKLSRGQQIYFDRQITDLMHRLDRTYPARLSLQDQGAFQLGYYHQTLKRFTKKEEQ